MTILVPSPDIQISFASILFKIRTQYLQDALSSTVAKLEVPDIDKELAEYVHSHSLSLLAAHGLRGELVFPVPLILKANPKLLGYYRLLYGFSQKEFYTSATGVGRFKSLEERGVINKNVINDLPELVKSLCNTGSLLLAGIGSNRINTSFLDDLTLLTLGPQLRGGVNVRKGIAGIKTVFNCILEIVNPAVVNVTESKIEMKNSAGRTVLIEFAPDPDIIIREEMRIGIYREIIAIEVKAGSDFSNIHNRIGEAEKSHQKARQAGYVECWTVVNVDRFDLDTAKRESPSTNRFYKISDLIGLTGIDYQDFRDRIVSLTNIT